MTARAIRRDANAKINLFLRVLSTREDGYHEIESLVVPISLADRIVVRPAEELRVEVAGAPAFSAGGLNLALVAALALADACPDAGGALVEIEKRIPVAGGLGGGSADAAATLLALNELWGCDVDAATLEEIGERIGSDVPAMLSGEPVLMAGRGERLAPAEVPPFHWVLVRFGFGVRSPDAYRWWDEDGAGYRPGPRPPARRRDRGGCRGPGASPVQRPRDARRRPPPRDRRGEAASARGGRARRRDERERLVRDRPRARRGARPNAVDRVRGGGTRRGPAAGRGIIGSRSGVV